MLVGVCCENGCEGGGAYHLLLGLGVEIFAECFRHVVGRFDLVDWVVWMFAV